MANKLFPVFDVPSQLAQDLQTEQKYRPAPLWDFEKGDFILDGTDRVLIGSGYDAWVLWCTKTILTQRWAHYGYSGNIGIEADAAFKKSNRKAVESALERTVTEALLADPMNRTRQVRDFNFEWGADNLNISCVVFGDNGDSATIMATLKG